MSMAEKPAQAQSNKDSHTIKSAHRTWVGFSMACIHMESATTGESKSKVKNLSRNSHGDGRTMDSNISSTDVMGHLEREKTCFIRT